MKFKSIDEAINAVFDLEERIASIKLEIKNISESTKKDKITGLYNQSAFYKEIDSNDYQSMLILNIDNLGSIAPPLPRATDRESEKEKHILREFGKIITSFSYKGDKVFRLFGDTYAVLSKNPEQELLNLAECIRHYMKNNAIEYEGATTRLTFSGGTATKEPTVKGLYEKSSRALHIAKQLGKDCVISHNNIKEFY